MNGDAALQALRDGGKVALARTLAALEVKPGSAEHTELLDAALQQPIGHAIGLTGPPGVGKSTLISRLIEAFRRREKSVAVIAVDPSSKRTGGALLGDRTRLTSDPDDSKIFIRSMAARDRLGGLADQVAPALWLLRALFDCVIIETVGVGQSETDISDVADTIVLAIQPGSGDSLQYMKAGIVEIPDIAVITKGDLAALASRAKRDLKMALALTQERKNATPVLIVSAIEGEGIEPLVDAMQRHYDELVQHRQLRSRRHAQSHRWLTMHVREQYGRVGLKRTAALLNQAANSQDQTPLQWVARVRQEMER